MNDRQTAFKDLSFKAKIEHIWEYYRVGIILGIFVVLIVGSIAKAMITHVEPVFSVMMVNTWSDQTKGGECLSKFLVENGYDAKEGVCDTSLNLVIDDPLYYQDQTQLFVLLASKEYDVMFSDNTVLEKYAPQGCYQNLENYLSEAQLKELEDNLYYTTDEKTKENYPCAIHLTKEESKWLDETYTYNDCYFMILYSDKTDEELMQKFISVLLKSE